MNKLVSAAHRVTEASEELYLCEDDLGQSKQALKIAQERLNKAFNDLKDAMVQGDEEASICLSPDTLSRVLRCAQGFFSEIEINGDTPLVEYFDSLDFLEFVMELEDEFNREISDEDAGKFFDTYSNSKTHPLTPKLVAEELDRRGIL